MEFSSNYVVIPNTKLKTAAAGMSQKIANHSLHRTKLLLF